MRILFITEHRYLPQYLGGMQTTADNLCHGLLNRGHYVSILASFMRTGFFGWRCTLQRKMLGRSVLKDRKCGYPVWRSWVPSSEVRYVARREQPDIIVVMAMAPVRMALAARPTGLPIVMQLHDTEFECHGGDFSEIRTFPCISNSHFTADQYRNAFGVESSVIYPIILPSDYQTTSTREVITFINPIAVKGLDIAVEIARRCPDLPFEFVEAWPLKPEQRRELASKLAGRCNVTLRSAQREMKQIYGKSKILLAPSIWGEAYGRVVTEAQLSAIPVIASAKGGLPEAVGPGGLLIDPEGPIEAWVAAIRRLWDDKAYYADLSSMALKHATRPELNFDYQVEAWERTFAEVASRKYS
jgi:glycosyltransferase involved in cell wall biosynthesis